MVRKLLLLLTLAIAAAGQQKPRPAPDFAFHMSDGSKTMLSAFRGKVVLVAFLNTGCEHCQHFAQELGPIRQDYAAKGVEVLAAVFDTGARQGLAKFRDQFVRGFPIGYSDEATVMNWLGQAAADGYFVPIVAFVDRKGNIVSQHSGDDVLFQDPETNIRHKLDLMVKQR